MTVEKQTNPMHPTEAPATAQDTHDKRPPAREPEWAQPYVQEPILDAAQVPLEAFEAAEPTPRAYLLYIWLHALRPLVVALFWIGVAFYAWRHFFRPTENMEDAGLLGLYLLGAVAVFMLVLLLAPLRRVLRREEESDTQPPRESTVFEVADFAEVTPRRLSAWSQARRLQVQHDEQGRLSHAADLDTQRRRRGDDLEDEPRQHAG